MSPSSLNFQCFVAQSSIFLAGKEDQLFYLLSRFMMHTDFHRTCHPRFLTLSDFIFIFIDIINIIYIFSLRTDKSSNSCYLNYIDKLSRANISTPDLMAPLPFFFICHTRNLFALQHQSIFFIILN